MHPKGILAHVMDFDPMDDRGLPPRSVQPLRTWLHSHPDAWLYPNFGPNLDQTFGQKVILLVGEAGSGKTTLLDSVSIRLDQPDNIIIRLDFTNAVNLMGDIHKDDVGPKFAEMTRDAVIASVHRQGLDTDFRAAKTRFIVRNIGHTALSPIREKYGREIEESDAMELLGNREIESAIAAYESQTSDGFVSIQAAQMIRSKRAILVVDNIDHLRPTWLVEVILEKLTGLIRSSTMTLAAIRAEHERAADVLLQGRRADVKYLDKDDSSVHHIARVRNDGALRYVQEKEPGMIPEAKARHEAVAKALDAIQDDQALLRLTTSWLNGNVRQMLTLITDLSLEVNHKIGTAASSDNSSIAGIVYSQAIKKVSPPRLIDVFEPQQVHTGKYPSLPFVFLPLRILAYLKARNGIAPQRQLFQDFNAAFGIEEQRVRSGLELLAATHFSRPSLIRRATDKRTASIVLLLPCGKIFIDDLVYSCDFMAHLYDNRPGLTRTSGPARVSEQKLEKAIIVTREIVVPAFMREHPYLNPKRAMKESERTRLNSYETMFNYGSGRWFIERLREKLIKYANAREIKTDQMSRLNQDLSRMVNRLDNLANGGR